MKYESAQQFITELRSKGYLTTDERNTTCPANHEAYTSVLSQHDGTVHTCEKCMRYSFHPIKQMDDPKGPVFKLEVDNLLDALSFAIDYAGEPNAEKYNACCLKVVEDGSFWITERTYSNVLFSSYAERLAHYCLTVTAKDYPGRDWPFNFLEFCTRYAIKITKYERTDEYGRVQVPAWEKITRTV